MKNICAPNKYDSNHGTCFTIEQLMEMAAAYNRYITKTDLSPDTKKHHMTSQLITIKPDKSYLLREFKKRFDKICGSDQVCWTQQDFMNEIVSELRTDITENFRPEGPSKSTEWLSTSDIVGIMTKYQNIFPEFYFLGAVPLDCEKHSFCSLYKFNFDEYYNKGIKYIGIVYNYDKYGKSGSHWVAMYIDLNGGEINYCDSGGKPAFGNILNMKRQFENFYQAKFGRKPIYKENTIKYQLDNSECGVYSCNFLIRRLYGESFEDIITNSLSFSEINSCRNIYFRNATSKYTPHKKCDPLY